VIRVFDSGEHEPQLAGAVRGVRLVRDSNSNLGKGFAYVLFASKTAALAALGMDGKECKGRAMRVTRVQASLGKMRGNGAAPTGGKKVPGGKPAAKAAGGKAAKDWQGTKTRGKGVALKPKGGVSKPKGAAKSVGSTPPGMMRKSGKRPSVLARKASALAASGKITAQQAKAVAAQAVASKKKDKRKQARKKGKKEDD